MNVYDSLGRVFAFSEVVPEFLPAGGLQLNYAEGHPDAGGMAAYFPAGGWVGVVELGEHVEVAS